jgi:hypothetical protein
MKKRLLSNKQIPIDIPRRLYQATDVNIALWGCESWALKEADSVSPWLSSQDVRVDDVGWSRETNHERTA